MLPRVAPQLSKIRAQWSPEPDDRIGSNPAELMIPALCRVHARYRSCLASVNTSGGANNGPKYRARVVEPSSRATAAHGGR